MNPCPTHMLNHNCLWHNLIFFYFELALVKIQGVSDDKIHFNLLLQKDITVTKIQVEEKQFLSAFINTFYRGL